MTTDDDDFAQQLLEFHEKYDQQNVEDPFDEVLKGRSVFCWKLAQAKPHPLEKILSLLVADPLQRYVSPHYSIKGIYHWPDRANMQVHEQEAKNLALRHFYADAETNLERLLNQKHKECIALVYFYEPEKVTLNATPSAKGFVGRRLNPAKPYSDYAASGVIEYMVYRKKTEAELAQARQTQQSEDAAVEMVIDELAEEK